MDLITRCSNISNQLWIICWQTRKIISAQTKLIWTQIWEVKEMEDFKCLIQQTQDHQLWRREQDLNLPQKIKWDRLRNYKALQISHFRKQNKTKTKNLMYQIAWKILIRKDSMKRKLTSKKNWMNTNKKTKFWRLKYKLNTMS